MGQSQSVNAQGPVTDNMGTDNGTIDQGQRTYKPRAQYDDTDISVITSCLSYIHGEDLMQKAQELIDALGNGVTWHVNITQVVRFRSRS